MFRSHTALLELELWGGQEVADVSGSVFKMSAALISVQHPAFPRSLA